MATGSMPAISANVVIMMGRRRLRPACISASSRSIPSRSSARAASSSRMAFFATSPISMMTPMMLMRLSVPCVDTSAITTPIRLSGSEIITGMGAVNEPNCITSTRYISATPETSAMPRLLKTSCWSCDAPVSSMPKPGGNWIALAIFIASAVTSPDERPCTLAATTTMRLEFAC